MRVGDVISLKLKDEPTPRLNVEITAIADEGIYHTDTSYFAWENIDDIRTESYRPEFKNGTRVRFNDEEYVKHQNKWYKVTNYNDGHVASAVEAGNATILGQ